MLLYDSGILDGGHIMAYFVVCWISSIIVNRITSDPLKKLLYKSTLFIGFATVKFAYIDQLNMDTNFYWYFGVPKSAPVGFIKNAYRRLANEMKIDAASSEDARMQHALLTYMYEILTDRRSRDIYNRFNIYAGAEAGGSRSVPDPRDDEFTLLLGIIGQAYLLWSLVVFATTLPKRFRAARTWLSGALFSMLLVEVLIKVAHADIPPLLVAPLGLIPAYTTEAEVVQWMHLSFPCVIVLLQSVSEYCYQDADECCVAILSKMREQQQLNEETFDYLTDLLALNGIIVTAASDAVETGQDGVASESGSAEGNSSAAAVAASLSKHRDNSGRESSDAAAVAGGDETAAVSLPQDVLQLTRHNLEKVKAHLTARRVEHAQLNQAILRLLDQHGRIVMDNSNDPLARYYWLLVVVLIGGAQFMAKAATGAGGRP